MTSTPQTLSQFVHEHTFYIPDYQNIPYKHEGVGYVYVKVGINKQRQLKNVVVDRAIYINYGESILMDGCQKEIFTFFLQYLALIAVGKVQGHEELSKLVAELDFAKLKKKFLFGKKEYGTHYRRFIKIYNTFVNDDNLTLEDLLNYSKRKYQRYNHFTRIFERYVAEIIKFSSKPESEETEGVECYTLTQQYKQLQSHLIVSIERNDIVLDSKKPLTIVDFFASKLATYNNAAIMERWQTFCDSQRASIIYYYFDDYLHLDYSRSFLDRLESELNALAEKASIQGHPQPQIAGVNTLLHRLEHLDFYPRWQEDCSRIMFLDADQERVSDLQCKWVAFYIYFIETLKMKSYWDKPISDFLFDLYFMYLEEQISLEEYLGCLHALFVSVSTNYLYNTRNKDKSYSWDEEHREVEDKELNNMDFATSLRKIDIAYSGEFFNKLNPNSKDYVLAFQEICRRMAKKPEGIDGKTPIEAAKFLVDQVLIANPRIHAFYNLYELLCFVITHQIYKRIELVEFLHPTNLEDYREFLGDMIGYGWLGNWVFINDYYEYYKCETPEERIAFIYSHLPFDQYLPPQGTEFTKEIIKQRTIPLAARLLEVMDFNRTEHLRLAD